MVKKFLRRGWSRYSKLGLRRKSKQKWSSPKGRHNKMRDKKRGYPATVSIGYRTDKESRGKIIEKTPIVVRNLKDLEKVKKENVVIIGKVGMKSKIEIAKEAEKKKMEVQNLNVKKFLKELKNKEKKK